MITPVLDLQGALQRIDQAGMQAAQTANESSNGEFGAAFAESFSDSSAAPGSSTSLAVGGGADGQTGVAPLLPSAAASNQFKSSVQSANTGATGRVVAASNQSGRTAKSAALAEPTASTDRASGALEEETEAVASSTSGKATDLVAGATYVPAGKDTAQESLDGLGVLQKSQEKSLATSAAAGTGAQAAGEIATASLEATFGRASSSAATLRSDVVPEGVSKAKGSDGSSKSKATEHVSSQAYQGTDLTASTANSNLSVLLSAEIAAGPSAGSSIAASASASGSARGLDASEEAAATALSGQHVSRRTSVAGLSADEQGLSTQAGVDAGRNGALAAWGSVEPTTASTAKEIAGQGRGFAEVIAQASSASGLGVKADDVVSAGATSGPSAKEISSGAGRSTAVLTPTSFTVSGEVRVPPVGSNASGAGSGGKPGLPGVSSLGRLTALDAGEGSQPVGAAGVASGAANLSPGIGLFTTEASKAVPVTHGRTQVATRPSSQTTTSGATGEQGIKRGSVVSAGAGMPEDTSVSNSDPKRLGDVGGEPVSNKALAVSNTASTQSVQTTSARSATLESPKAVGADGATLMSSLPAVNGVPQGNDRGLGDDAASNVAAIDTATTTHIANAAGAEHIAPAAGSSGASVGAEFAASIASQGVQQGAAAGGSTLAAQHAGGVGALGSLRAAAEADPAHASSTLHSSVASESHQTLEATPTSLEVGIHSGTQGWLKIRAEVGGEGEVSASLAAASPSGEQMLKGQLPALNAYLHSEQISLTASVAERTGITHGVVAHEAGGTALQAGTSSSNGHTGSLLDSGAGQRSQNAGSGSRSDGSSAGVTRLENQISNRSTYTAQADPSEFASRPSTADASGQWLNVTV